MKTLIKPLGIVVHHTVGRETATVEEIDRYHREERGFDMIGYHYLVHRVADEWEAVMGRPERYRGAHCKGKQGHLGVSVAGNYEDSQICDDALDCLINKLIILCVKHGFDPSQITYHQMHKSSTLCPGRFIITRWPDIIEEVADRLPLNRKDVSK